MMVELTCDRRRQPAASQIALSPSALNSRPAASPSVKLMTASFLLLVVVGFLAPGTRASPPLDYFVYTSQLMNTPPGGLPPHSILPPLKSIYTPNMNTTTTASSSNNNNNNPERDHLVEQMRERVLALVSNSSHRHDNDLSDLETTRFAWNLMEQQALNYMKNRVHALQPTLQELLDEAKISRACNASINLWLTDLTQLKHWATLMWNSWGQFPTAGVFQGSYTDLGSYSGCMSIEDNQLIGAPQYCMLDFQPIVPSRPRFHSIFKRVLGYDARRHQLTGGDFDRYAQSGGELPTGSRLVSHQVSSSRFNELSGRQSHFRHPRPELNEKDAELLALLAAGDDNNVADELANAAAGKLSKRTISHAVASSADNAALNDIGEPSMWPLAGANASQRLNLTLKAEALVELALKAQYFYYVKFRIGACFPTHCSRADVQKLAKAGGKRAILQSVEVNCMKKEPFTLNTYQLVAICILSVLALIAVLGAVVDLLGYKEDTSSTSAFINWLLPFSIWTNAKRLFALEAAGTHSDLECVHGLRFFSMVWVIYGHTILYMEYQSFTHFYDVIETQIPSFLLLPSLNANFSVDTFFVISGILTTYVTWEYTKGDARKFNKFAFMISRYIRLTPQLAIVILCFFLLPLFGDGPMYHQVADDKAEVCYRNWAINLLYLQSYINAEKHCIDPSWWLSVEMTFHVISVLVIIVMIQNVKRGMIVNAIVASALMLWGATIHYSNGLAIQYLPSIPQRFEVRSEQTKLFFHRPYPHAASYFIGIALGYVLANKTIKKLNKRQLWQGWSVCAIGLITSLWGSYFWNLGAPYDQLQATIYYNVCQILWPIAVAWIILACSLGHGGPVNAILSARIFVPLGRITYMTYLSHALIIYYHSARMSITLEPSMLLFTYLFIANTALALALGVALTVVYESPILNLQKQLFAYLTEKFDPTKRDANSNCRPTRLVSSSHANGGVNGFTAAKGAGASGNHYNTEAIMMDDQNTAPLLSNGFQKTGAKSTSALNTCLLLDANNDKQRDHSANAGEVADKSR